VGNKGQPEDTRYISYWLLCRDCGFGNFNPIHYYATHNWNFRVVPLERVESERWRGTAPPLNCTRCHKQIRGPVAVAVTVWFHNTPDPAERESDIGRPITEDNAKLQIALI